MSRDWPVYVITGKKIKTRSTLSMQSSFVFWKVRLALVFGLVSQPLLQNERKNQKE